jgi:hypothetical protein
MPQKLEKLVSKLLADKDFYPELPDDERKSRAYAIANKQLNADEVEAIVFEQLNSPVEITIEATENGDLLRFKNAVLARVESNRNQDEISPENITELAATLAGRAIDIDHNRRQNVGVITSAHSIEDGTAVAIDGILWKDRYPEEVDGVQNGTHHLSVEAKARTAICSKCELKFEGSTDYCDHLKNRKRSGAKRRFEGMVGDGAGITPKPAGTRTHFDRNQIFVVASHKETELMKCPRCGKDSGEGDNCSVCGKDMRAEVIAKELFDKEAELTQALAELEALKPLKAELETAHTEKTTAQEQLTAAEQKVKDAEEALKAAEEKIAAQKSKERADILKPLLTEAAFKEKLVKFQAMDDDTFETVVASLQEVKPSRIPALRSGMPSPALDSEKSGIRLK